MKRRWQTVQNVVTRQVEKHIMAGHSEITPEEERRKRELMLDKTLADSFPASDPPSSDPNPCPDDLERAA